MAINGIESKLGDKAAPWVRQLEAAVNQILAQQASIIKDIAYLKQRVK